MDINRIYFDMDGVLSDFDRGIWELCGISPIAQEEQTEQQTNDMFAAMRSVGHFYAKLEPVAGAVKMLNDCWRRYGDKCEILTGIPKPGRGIDDAADDKLAWIKRMFDFDIKVNIVYRAEKKSFCKGKGDILVDDLRENILEWETAGGTGILFINAEETLRKLGICRLAEEA